MLTTDLGPPASLDLERPPANAPTRRLFPALDRPGDALKHLGPNWFAVVMGTGIVATAGVTLPVQVAGQRTAALAVWAGAAVLLLVAGRGDRRPLGPAPASRLVRTSTTR